MVQKSNERTWWLPTGTTLIVLVGATMFLVGTLAVGATVPSDRSDTPVAGQQATNGFTETVDTVEADARFVGEATNDSGGWSVSTAGDVNDDGVDDLIVGAPNTVSTNNGTGTESDIGTAYLFFGPTDRDDLDLSEADMTLSGESPHDWAGFSVGAAGDLNGDGIDDVLVGAPLNSANGENAGAVYVIHGGSWLPDSMSLADANATLYGDGTDRAGWSVSNASGVGSGDGEPGVLIGAVTDDDVGDDAGAAFLVGASSIEQQTLLETDSDAKFVGENAGDHAGHSVSWVGDVDDDGTGDVLVGAMRNDGNGNNSGAAYIVSVDRNGTVDLADANVTMRGTSAFDEAGYAVSGAGDLNDDGLPDVVVGAPFNDSAATDAGAAYVVYGSSSMPATIELSEANVTLAGADESDFAGWSVAGAGDVTCDRTDDVLVGAPWSDESGTNAGAAYLISGDQSLSGTTNLEDAETTFLGGDTFDRFGFSLGPAGDLNADGAQDVLIGAPYNDFAGDEAGSVYLFVSDCPTPPERTPEPTEPPVETPTETPIETPPPTTETPTETPIETPTTPIETPEETPVTPASPIETPEDSPVTPTETPGETPTTPIETPEGTPITPTTPIETPEETTTTPTAPIDAALGTG